MNIEQRKDQIPDEFKQLAQDFSDNGFITTSLDNQLIGLEQVHYIG